MLLEGPASLQLYSQAHGTSWQYSTPSYVTGMG